MKKLFHRLVYFLFLFAVVEATAFVGLRLFHIPYAPVDSLSEKHRSKLRDLVQGKTDYIGHSPTLGWTLKPHGFSPLYQANAQGMRGDREYSPSPPPGIFRIASFGDSFTHGDEVDDADTWQEKLSRLAPDLEVLNFGVPGYGTDQAFLRYREEGVRFGAHVVLIGFMSENVFRHVNVFRPFYLRSTGLPLAKPRFVTAGDGLVLVPNPLPELAAYEELLEQPETTLRRIGRHDYFFQIKYKRGPLDFLAIARLLKIKRNPVMARVGSNRILDDGRYNPSSEAFRVTAAILDAFCQTAIAEGSQPVVLIFPSRQDLKRHFEEGGSKPYAPLVAHLEARGHRHLDLAVALEEAAAGHGLGPLIGRHYTPLGNEVVARSIGRYLGIVDFSTAGAEKPVEKSPENGPGSAPDQTLTRTAQVLVQYLTSILISMA